MLDVIRSFEKACGHKLPYEIKPRRPGDVDANYADASKAKRELGWQAELGLDDMTKSVCVWMEKNPYGYKNN